MKKLLAFTAGAVTGPVAIVGWAWWKIGKERRVDIVADIRKTWDEETAKNVPIDPKTYVSAITYEAHKTQDLVHWIIDNWYGSTYQSAIKLLDDMELEIGDRLELDFEGGVNLIKAHG